VTLDEDHTDDVLLVAGDENGVLADENTDGGLVGDLAQPHCLQHDRLPALLANPRRVAGLRLLCRHVENRDDTVVAKNALNTCR
jgi:hypothetical protein